MRISYVQNDEHAGMPVGLDGIFPKCAWGYANAVSERVGKSRYILIADVLCNDFDRQVGGLEQVLGMVQARQNDDTALFRSCKLKDRLRSTNAYFDSGTEQPYGLFTCHLGVAK